MSNEQNYNIKNSFNKEEWIKKKNKERDATYKKIDLSAKFALEGGVVFKQYLDIQSKFTDYSVGNALLISLQMPETTIFKDKENWKKIGVNVKEGAKGFKILEPSSPYIRKDGTKATYYNPKEMFDISQTDGKPSEKAKVYSEAELLKAFITKCPVKVQAVDVLSDGTHGAEYNKEDDTLYICRGIDSKIMFQSVLSELARISLEDKEQNDVTDFECYCVSYMLCNKYGIDNSNYKFEKLPEEIKSMDIPSFRKELDCIRSTMLDVNSRIKDNLEKHPKMKQYER